MVHLPPLAGCDYECWWGLKTLPNVNEMDEGLPPLHLEDEDSVVRHWVKKGASGWRLTSPTNCRCLFCANCASRLRMYPLNAAVLGEVWEDASHKVAYGQMRSYVLGDTLDSVMNIRPRRAFIAFLTGQKDAPAVARELSSLAQNYPFLSGMNGATTGAHSQRVPETTAVTSLSRSARTIALLLKSG